MRSILVCTALCIACPLGSSAGFSDDRNLTSVAFGAGYASSDELTAERSSEAGQSSPCAAEAAAAAPEESPRAFSKGELCSAAASVAEANNLPVPFFANLIQQESDFKPNVVSPAGAQGIAQFMPRVAVA